MSKEHLRAIIIPSDYWVMGDEELPDVINALCRLFTYNDVNIYSSYAGENTYCKRRTLKVRITPYDDGTRVRQNLTIFTEDGKICLHSPIGSGVIVAEYLHPATCVKIHRFGWTIDFAYYHGNDTNERDIVGWRRFSRSR